MGIAALWIYDFHIVPVGLFVPEPSDWAVYFHREGFCGVDIFLLVSGFGLTYAFGKQRVTGLNSYGRYLIRRFLRIGTVLIPAALVIGLVDNWTLREFLGRATGLRQLWVNVYDFLWFVPCILLFYLFAPFYYALFDRVKWKGAFTLGAIALVLAANVGLQQTIRYDLYAITTRIPVFLLGFYFGHLSLQGKKLSAGGMLATAACLFVGVAYSFSISHNKDAWLMPAYNAQVNLIVAPAFALLLANLCQWAMGIPLPQAVRWLGKGVYTAASLLGVISFEFYVVQEWVWLKMRNSSTLQAWFGSSMVQMQLGCFLLTLIGAVALHWVAGCLHRSMQRSQ